MDSLERGARVLEVAAIIARLPDSALDRLSAGLAAPDGDRELVQLICLFYRWTPAERTIILAQIQAQLGPDVHF